MGYGEEGVVGKGSLESSPDGPCASWSISASSQREVRVNEYGESRETCVWPLPLGEAFSKFPPASSNSTRGKAGYAFRETP